MTVPDRLPPLYGCEPIGLGTALVEGVVSFFTRLCHRRLVGPHDVVDGALHPRVAPDAFVSRTSTAQMLTVYAGRFESLGEDASAMVSALEAATSRRGLRAHTMLPFSPLFGQSNPSRVVVVGHRRWCPACFAHWASDGTPLYEPLLWRLPAVTHCSVHRTALVRCCPRCGVRQRALALWVPIGVCWRCGHALSPEPEPAASRPASSDDAARWAWSRTLAAGRMLVAVAAGGVPSPDGFRRLLSFVLDGRGARGLDRRQLRIGLGVYSATFHQWCDGRAFPILRWYVDACHQLGADPVEVMLPGFDPADRTWPPPGDPVLASVGDPWGSALRARECASERSHPQWAQHLDALADRPLDSALKEVASAVGVGPLQLESLFPSRFARLRDARERHLACVRERMRAALEQAIAAGGSVTPGQVARQCGVTLPTLAASWPELDARLRALLPDRLSSTDSSFQHRAATALGEALRVPCGPSARAVADSLGTTTTLLMLAAPDLYRELVELRRLERESLRAHVRRGLAAEARRDVPRPGPELARELGVCVSDLYCEADLYPRFLHKRQEARVALHAKVRAALEAELGLAAPRSAHALARALGVKIADIRREAQLYARLLEVRRAPRLACRARVRAALEAELRTEAPRTCAALARALGVPTSDVEREADLYPQLLEARRRVRHAVSRIRAALAAELQRPAPRSCLALARILRVRVSDLRRQGDLYGSLVEKRRAPRLARRAVVRAALEAELASDLPRTCVAVARALGVAAWQVECEADLYSRFVEHRRRTRAAGRPPEAQARDHPVAPDGP